jgi:hypothetical protein
MISRIVNVTLEDIHLGIREDSCLCPIARALERTFQDMGGEPEVDEGLCTVKFDDGHVAYGNPQIEDFISKFDAGEPVEPFSFTFESDYYKIDGCYDHGYGCECQPED